MVLVCLLGKSAQIGALRGRIVDGWVQDSYPGSEVVRIDWIWQQSWNNTAGACTNFAGKRMPYAKERLTSQFPSTRFFINFIQCNKARAGTSNPPLKITQIDQIASFVIYRLLN
jgi:hypothetical protein